MERHGQMKGHPSDQVKGYVEQCRSFHSAIHERKAAVHGCVVFTSSRPSPSWTTSFWAFWHRPPHSRPSPHEIPPRHKMSPRTRRRPGVPLRSLRCTGAQVPIVPPRESWAAMVLVTGSFFTP
jgi:hypothetical protein